MTAVTKNPTMQGGGGNHGARVGLVTVGTLAGEGCPTSEPCKYCGETDGHTAQCVVVSHHARLGVYARWTCKGCTATQFPGRFPCRECTGYTTSNEKVVRGVLTVWGKPNVRCPQ